MNEIGTKYIIIIWIVLQIKNIRMIVLWIQILKHDGCNFLKELNIHTVLCINVREELLTQLKESYEAKRLMKNMSMPKISEVKIISLSIYMHMTVIGIEIAIRYWMICQIRCLFKTKLYFNCIHPSQSKLKIYVQFSGLILRNF